jgi:hypothetical protein
VKAPQAFKVLALGSLFWAGALLGQGGEIAGLEHEKASRTAAQQKLDSQIVLALKKMRGEAPFDHPSKLEPSVTVNPDGMVLVDIDGAVSVELLQTCRRSGGKVMTYSESAHSIRALLPLAKLESLAARPDVRFISPAAEAANNRAGPGAPQ